MYKGDLDGVGVVKQEGFLASLQRNEASATALLIQRDRVLILESERSNDFVQGGPRGLRATHFCKTRNRLPHGFC